MPSLSRSSRSRPASNRSRRASYRDAAQQTSRSRSSSRRRSVSPPNRRPHRTPTPSPTRPSAKHPNRKRFGLNVPTNQARIGKFDFEEIYPEDPIYDELGPNARVWRVNLDECEVFDNDMVVEARDGLDLLLVFAGLFSAVLTTFVAQTSQALSNNFPAVSTSLLLEMVTLHRAFINGTPIDRIFSSEIISGPSGFDVWVNALWFTSLTLSLGTALMAVLVKQWLYQYLSIVSGTARDRSLIRFYRFDGLRKWHVLTIIGTLPIILHVALGLFLAGLVVFLIPLNVPLATIVGFITVVIYTMYTVSNILPIIYTQCPYRTPFSDILNILMRPTFTFFSFISSSGPVRALHISLTPVVASTARIFKPFSTRLSNLFGASAKTSLDPSTSHKFPTLKEAERSAATDDGVAEGIACDALVWLHQMTSNPPTKSIVLQSLGCLSEGVSGQLSEVCTYLDKALEEVIHRPRLYSIRPGQESRAERLLRAQRHVKIPQIERHWWQADAEAFKPPFHTLAAILTYAPTKAVEFREMRSRDWYNKDLLVHIMQEYNAGRPILLPSILWQRLMTGLDDGDIDQNLLLCRLALSEVLDNLGQAPSPFSDGVPLTLDMVPLNHLITNMWHRDDLSVSIPLHQLFIINDYIVSELSNNRNRVMDDAVSMLLVTWTRIPLRPDDRTSGDSLAICRRAEKCILEAFVGDWWDGMSKNDILIRCYRAVVEKYRWHCRRGTVPSLKLFTKLISELRWSAVDIESGHHISAVLEYAFSLDIESATSYFTLLCGSESPLFSPRTELDPNVLDGICRVVAAFVSGLARGSHPPALTHQCMEFLRAESDRLFTVCRILGLEHVSRLSFRTDSGFSRSIQKDATENILKLVRLHANRAAWHERTRYLIGIEPWDWPYFHIPKDHEQIQAIQERMQFVLKILDDFFASMPPTRVRKLALGLSSSPINIQPAGPSNDRSSTNKRRHTLATIEPGNATAGPSLLPAPVGNDSMV